MGVVHAKGGLTLAGRRSLQQKGSGLPLTGTSRSGAPAGVPGVGEDVRVPARYSARGRLWFFQGTKVRDTDEATPMVEVLDVAPRSGPHCFWGAGGESREPLPIDRLAQVTFRGADLEEDRGVLRRRHGVRWKVRPSKGSTGGRCPRRTSRSTTTSSWPSRRLCPGEAAGLNLSRASCSRPWPSMRRVRGSEPHWLAPGPIAKDEDGNRHLR